MQKLSAINHNVKPPDGKVYPVHDERQCAEGCDICGGSGWFSYDVDIHHNFFGELFLCPNVPIDSSALNFYGLQPNERLYRWDDLERIGGDGQIKLDKAKKAVKAVLELGRGMVYLHGSYGLAKSMILKIAVAECLRYSRSVDLEDLHKWNARYTHMDTIYNELRSCFDGYNKSAALQEVKDKYLNIPILCIDEVGLVQNSDWEDKEQFHLIDWRYTQAIENEQNLITIMGSNLTPAELPPRIQSRLEDGRCFVGELAGTDYRLIQQPLEEK